jgi:type I restriction enzyme S subunit
MKQGWEIKKLGEVVEVLDNLRKPITKRDRIEGEYPYFGATGILSYVHNYIFSEKLVLIGEDGAKWLSGDNTSFIAEGKYWVNNHAHVIRPIRKLIMDEWIVYFLNFSDLTPFITGMTVPKLNQEKMRSIPIPLPPLPEQQRIVAILDEAFAAIAKAKANAEQNLKNAKELFESYLQGVFENGNKNWETKCLDELGTITSSKRIYKSEYVKDGVPFYRTKEIKELSNGKNITLELFISKDRYNEIKKSFGVPQINDLLMSAVGTIGEIMVIENNDEFYFKDGNIVWFKGFKSLDTNYLKFALTAFVEKIKSLAIGAAYSALTIEKLNKYKISFPKTLKEQQAIVQKLDAISTETKKLEAIYQQKINDLEELKKSILQKAFSGELKTGKVLV